MKKLTLDQMLALHHVATVGKACAPESRDSPALQRAMSKLVEGIHYERQARKRKSRIAPEPQV